MSDKMREEFEAWASSEHMNLTICQGSQPNVVYLMAETNFTWRAWQASRSAVVIELPELNPEMFSCNVIFGHEKARNEATKAIEAAGLKVKP